jgi:hypothetical protein
VGGRCGRAMKAAMTDEMSDYLRHEWIVDLADEMISFATSMREAYHRQNFELGDTHFEQASLVGREIRRTRAEMADRQKKDA